MKKCMECGTGFSEDGTSRKYCCKACALKAAGTQRIEWNTKHRVYRRAVIKCPLCGEAVKPSVSGSGYFQAKYHEECVVADIINTVRLGKALTKTQTSRKYRLGLTNKEIKELICNAAT